MFNGRTSHFKTQTFFPALVNKQILQIDIFLREIRLVNRANCLWAQGFIGRRINYLEFDGRSRKAEDQIQFQVALGDPVLEPALLKSELSQDYFIFQPRNTGGGQAILEQEFTLRVWETGPDQTSPSVLPLLADSITHRGEGSIVLDFPVAFPEAGVKPKAFDGVARFENGLTPLTSAEVKGIITYRSRDHIIREIEFEQTVSFLINNAPSLLSNQRFFARGEIVDVAWAEPVTGQGWTMKLKLSYEWLVTAEKELACHMKPEMSQAPAVKIRTPQMVEERRLEIPKTFFLPFHILPPTEVKLVTRNHQEKFTKKGLLLSAGLTAEIYYLGTDGREAFQTHELFLIELADLGQSTGDHREVVAGFEPVVVKFGFQGNQLRLETLFKYELKIYQPQITEVLVGDNSSEAVLAKIFTGSKTFSFLGENKLFLRRQPSRIEKTGARLTSVIPLVKNGWFSLKGRLEIVISYIDREQTLREDAYQISFQEHFIWDKLNEESNLEVSGKLEYDSYTIEDSVLSYKYLLNFEVEAYQERELKVAVVENQNKPGPVGIDHQDQPSGILFPKIILEGEVPLKYGRLQEIIQSNARLMEFCYQSADNALVVEGSLSGELEYWDDNGYFRREVVELPFWRLLQHQFHEEPNCLDFIPEIRRYNYTPRQVRPWQKGNIKITVELELKPVSRGDPD
jgi:hypothetical protein